MPIWPTIFSSPIFVVSIVITCTSSTFNDISCFSLRIFWILLAGKCWSSSSDMTTTDYTSWGTTLCLPLPCRQGCLPSKPRILSTVTFTILWVFMFCVYQIIYHLCILSFTTSFIHFYLIAGWKKSYFLYYCSLSFAPFIH